MMYAAIWRALPGPLVVRVLLAAVLVLAVVAVLLPVGVPADRAADAVQRQHRRPERRRSSRTSGRPDDPHPRRRQLRQLRLHDRRLPPAARRRVRGRAQRRRRVRPTAPTSTGCSSRPGPGTPEEAGVSMAMIEACAERAQPMLGVCLGHQALGVVVGATVGRAPELLHGKTSQVLHDDTGVLERAAVAVHRDPLPLADDRPRDRARHAGRQRAHRVRHHHGRPAPRPAAARRAVPPRERADRGRSPDPRQLAGRLRAAATRSPARPASARWSTTPRAWRGRSPPARPVCGRSRYGVVGGHRGVEVVGGVVGGRWWPSSAASSGVCTGGGGWAMVRVIVDAVLDLRLGLDALLEDGVLGLGAVDVGRLHAEAELAEDVGGLVAGLARRRRARSPCRTTR